MNDTFSRYNIRGALCDWINAESYTHALTLNTDRELSASRLRDIFGTFCHKLDRKILGTRHVGRVPAAERLRAIAFPEGLATNAHLHAAIDLTNAMKMFGDVQGLEDKLRCFWLQSTHGSGTIDLQPLTGSYWPFYMTKGFSAVHPTMFLSADYHPA